MDDGQCLEMVANDLASMSDVDLGKASKATRRSWCARALALEQLAKGDMAEAMKIMENSKKGKR